MLLDLIKKSRSYRRFRQDAVITREELLKMVEAARYSPSSRNIQPIKYILSNNRDINGKIFPLLGWAGYLTDWDGPAEGERPSAYIIQILDKSISQTTSCDHGITAQSILLQSVELGYGGCIIASVKRDALATLLEIDTESFEIIQVIALGKPVEEVVVDDMNGNDYKYWREVNGKHHVPKRTVDELVIKIC